MSLSGTSGCCHMSGSAPQQAGFPFGTGISKTIISNSLFGDVVTARGQACSLQGHLQDDLNISLGRVSSKISAPSLTKMINSVNLVAKG